jgi:hypothetical protein
MPCTRVAEACTNTHELVLYVAMLLMYIWTSVLHTLFPLFCTLHKETRNARF